VDPAGAKIIRDQAKASAAANKSKEK
jgi:hypothetical protein